MPVIKKSKRQQQTEAIVKHVLEQRARQRQIPIGCRILTVMKLKGADYRVNKHEVKIDIAFATTGNPVTAIDAVIDAIEHFDRRLYEDRAKQIVRIKSRVLDWANYLERQLSPKEYEEFVLSLLPSDIDTLAPDVEREFFPGEQDLDYVTAALLAEGERMQDKGIYFRA